jgi:hypothetical protein
LRIAAEAPNSRQLASAIGAYAGKPELSIWSNKKQGATKCLFSGLLLVLAFYVGQQNELYPTTN